MILPARILPIIRILILAALFGSVARGVHAQYDIQVVKSAYLERFTRFIEWPESAGSDTTGIFTIGLVNGSDFGKVLRDVFSSQKILGKEVGFINLEKPGDIGDCHLCYINGLRRQQLEEYIYTAQESGVILVGDTPGYGRMGVHFNFVVVENKVKFEINEDTLKGSGFKVSHLLYKSGIIL